MAQAKTLHVPIGGGMRQDLSEHAAPVGTIVDAKNVRFSAVGEVEARPGSLAIPVATDAEAAYAGNPDFLTGVPGGFVFGTGGYGYVYDAGTGRVHASGSYSIAEPLGRMFTIAREELGSGTTFQMPFALSQAVATNGYIAISYSGEISASPTLVIFSPTGQVVATFDGESYSRAYVVAVGNTFYWVAQNVTNVALQRVTVDANGVASMIAFANLFTLNSVTSYWAICSLPGAGWAFVGQTAATTVSISTMSGATGVFAVTFANTSDSAPVSIYSDGVNIYVGFVNVNAGAGDCVSLVRVYDMSLALTSGGSVTVLTDVGYSLLSQTAPIFGGYTSGGALMAVGRRNPATPARLTRLAHILPNGTLTSGSTVLTGSMPESAPFANGMIWLATKFDVSESYQRCTLADFSQLRLGTLSVDSLSRPSIAAVCDAFGERDYLAIDLANRAAPIQMTDGTWVAGVARMVRSQAPGLTASGDVLLLAEWLMFSLSESKTALVVGGSPLVSGQLSYARSQYGTWSSVASVAKTPQYLGEDVGFPGPPSISLAASNSTGNLTSSCVYQYRAVIERIDQFGVRHRSAPSRVVSITMGAADDTVTATISAEAAWLRSHATNPRSPSAPRVHLYRTTANGSTFYRVTPSRGAPAAISTYVDGATDVAAAQSEILYTDGGVLSNDFPPSARFLRATEDRVWLGGLWASEQIQSSKTLVPGEPPQFSDSPAFRVVLPAPCTGIAVQDGVVVAFTRRAVYGIQGGGPNDQGQGEWGSPRLITGSTGCISHLSILETSVGIFFQSEEGIELLPRGLGEPQFVGMPVQDLMYSSALGAVAMVVSASVVTTFRGRTARFVLDDGASSNVILVYDLDTQSWSRDDYGTAIDAIADTEDGAVLARHTPASGYGFLLESLAQDRDNVGSTAVDIASELEWAELRPFGPAGFGRFTSAIGLFDARSAPSSGYRAGSATITLSVDSRTESGKTFTMTSLTETAAYQRNVPQVQEGTCGKLTLTTAVGGWRFVGWTVEAEDLGGGRRMGETEQG